MNISVFLFLDGLQNSYTNLLKSVVILKTNRKHILFSYGHENKTHTTSLPFLPPLIANPDNKYECLKCNYPKKAPTDSIILRKCTNLLFISEVNAEYVTKE